MIVITIVPHNYSILALYLSVLLSQTIVITLTLHHLKYQFEININIASLSFRHKGFLYYYFCYMLHHWLCKVDNYQF